MAEAKECQELDLFLKERYLRGLWNIKVEERPPDPKTHVKPHLWRWADVYQGLLQAKEQVDVESGGVERRSIYLVNPGWHDTTHTLHVAIQLIQPGEVAPAHRHTMAAIRFILQGKGAYTTVEGQKMKMEEGDLILTPQWTWHEHGHEGEGPMIWLDGLDLAFIQSLQVISFEPYSGKRQVLKSISDLTPAYSMTRPVASSPEGLPPPLHYRWRHTYAALKRLAEGQPHPYDGVALEYVSPLTGGPTLPTMSCWIQMLRPLERTQAHRHTSTSIYHVFRGSGATVINGEPFHWEKGDTFVVPLWSWHEHANRSSREEALLFSLNDAPILKAFGLYREEGPGKSNPGV
jgi:gentisate 1,2-dioxygenase